MVTRWSILAAVSGMLWGVYFVYDLPASLSTSLQTHLDLSPSRYAYLISALYTAYSAPNIILPFLSGFAAQRYGQRRILLFSLAAVVFGQLIFGAALQAKENAAALVFARVVMGFGGEVLGVLGIEIVTCWFQEHKLALALATVLGVSRLGSVANSALTPRLIHTYGIVQGNWMGTALALLVSTVCAVYILIVGITASGKEEPSQANFKQSLRRLSSTYWQLSVICVMLYGCIGPFSNSAQRFIASRFYGEDQEAAGFAVSIPWFLSAALTFPFGLLLENSRLKNYPLALLLSSGMILFPHVLLLLNIGGPIFPLVILGIAYALFGVAFWPAVACSIPNPKPSLSTDEAEYTVQGDGESIDELLDTLALGQGPPQNDELLMIGYGIMTSLMNMSMALVPVFLAAMENVAGDTGLELVFVGLSIGGVAALIRFPW